MASSVLPGIAVLRGYDRAWLRGDVVAGVAVAAYAVPQTMAYADLAGLPPIAGVWGLLAPLLVYALLGSSRQLAIGPESTTAVMTAVAIGPLAAGDPSAYAALAAAAALGVGVVCLVAAAARLAFLADLLSRPILIGYLAGLAFIMIAGQLGTLAGVSLDSDSFAGDVRAFVEAAPDWHPESLALGVTVLVLLLVSQRVAPAAPGPLIGVLLATLAVMALGTGGDAIALVGNVPAGLPSPELPAIDRDDLSDLALPVLAIALVAFSDVVLTGRAFSSRRGEDIDARQELVALGVSNLGTGLTQSLPVSSSASRTAVGDLLGSRTQLYSLVVLATLVLSLVVLGGVLEEFPRPALAAIVVFAALRIIDVREFRRLARFRLSELGLALATLAGVLVLDILNGVLLAVGLSMLELLARVARPHDAVLARVPGIAGMHDVDDYPTARPIPGLVVYRYDAPLFFANAEDFRRRALASVDDAQDPVRWFVLNVEANVEIDITAVDAVQRLRQALTARGVTFAMARVKQDLRAQLERAGFLDDFDEALLFPTLPTAVEGYERAAAGSEGSRPDDPGG